MYIFSESKSSTVKSHKSCPCPVIYLSVECPFVVTETSLPLFRNLAYCCTM